MTKNKTIYFPPEWYRQSAVLLSWPHADSDWAYMLSEVQTCFKQIAKAVVKQQKLIIVAPDISDVKRQLSDLDCSRIDFYEMPTNDTWARDFAPLTVFDGDNPVLLDFKFNAWGMKFAACYDNLVCRRLNETGVFQCDMRDCQDFVLEGGSVESDGSGTLLTTSDCLLEANRNSHLSQPEIENRLVQQFGVRKVLWLNHGALAGDDTDSHIDTLARFAPNNVILYSSCDNPDDVNYDELGVMECQLESMTNAEGKPYKLMPLPIPKPIFDDEGNQLPATYANFLIMNNQVLVPTYGQKSYDEKALATIAQAFPAHKVIGIDCNALIKQHGSLHCVTMQFPLNVIKK